MWGPERVREVSNAAVTAKHNPDSRTERGSNNVGKPGCQQGCERSREGYDVHHDLQSTYNMPVALVREVM
jgi:hypothetical protein